MRFFLIAATFILLAIWTLTNAIAGEFKDGDKRTPELCLGWIDQSCSCTHRSCWEARPGEFESLGNNQWREKSSGQIVTQRDWSQDGSFMVCAWKPGEFGSGIEYHVGKGNPIKCLFPPLPSS